MTPSAESTWQEANQQHLLQALGDVRAALLRLFPEEPAAAGDPGALPVPPGGEASSPVPPVGEAAPVPPGGEAAPPVPPVGEAALSPPPALSTLCAAFELTPFERNVLLMCAGAEMDSGFAAIFARAHNDPRRTLPTFSLALAAFADGHWSALTPSRPLRSWHLLEVLSGGSLTASPLRISERVLHYLAGVDGLDERLKGLFHKLPVPKAGELSASHQAIAGQMAAAWSPAPGAAPPILELCGNDAVGKRAVAAAACATMGLQLYVVSSAVLPRDPAALQTCLRLWEREALLTGSALLLEFDDAIDRQGEALITALLELSSSPLLVSAHGAFSAAHRAVLRFDVLRPAEQLWDAAGVKVRPRLDGLAQRIEPAATWDDLVLHEQQKQILSQIAVHVQHRAQVYLSWGFAAKGSRGLGISALFAGSSGTGKTMAAEVLAQELGLPLYRIDLSQVVSKYIGETEKNLRRVFDAADEGAAVLLFDEADALFGKRSEVKDSHDRYANIEVSYLLQRMEAYRGLAILTTNRKTALDQAFLRRIRFVVEFPIPEAAQRAEIWRRVFPVLTPTEGLKIDRLARLSAAGGHIRNIAMGAAFLAAHEGAPVRMGHLLRAARSEFTKMEKPLTDAEVAGWV
jgi:hypothetical protein